MIYIRDLRMLGLDPKNIFESTQHVTTCAIGLNIQSPFYGKILCEFHKDGRTFKLYFDVYDVIDDDPENANRATLIEEVITKEDVIDGVSYPYYNQVATSFGTKAFWSNTPDDSLDEDALFVRGIIRKLKEFSEQEDLVEYFKLTIQAARATNKYI